MPANPTHLRFGRWFSVLTLVGVLLLIHLVQFADAAAAPNPPPVQIYFIPVPENQTYAAFSGIYPGGATDKCNSAAPNVASPINTYVSISIISAGTIVYYDQWEDDFEIDIAHPVQPTTQIWGDANPANGFPPGIPGDVLSPDTVVVLNNAVPVPRQPAILFFDGGDKIGASRPIAVTRATWSGSYPQAPGTLLADALEVYDTNRWGTRYQAPVGVSTAANQLFEYTGMAIMAAEDNTTVTLDANADLAGEAAIVLNEGESYLIDGGVQAGTIVNASAPVQVALITGDICDTYESRWFVLFPTERWSGSYYTPVGTPTGGGGTTIWLFNPGVASLGVSWEISSGLQAPLTIAPLSAISAVVPNNSGAHFFTPDGSPFAALAAVGADSPSPSDNSRADWGFTLVPDSQLTYQTLVGWGAGRDPTSSVNPTENGSPVWVIPVLRSGGAGPVAVCVDYDGNNAGPLTDAYGFKYDQLLSLAKLESQKVFDPDGDQTGMVLYVCDPPASPTGAELATAWGQAPGIASAAEPGLDLGTTAPPAATFEAGKGADITGDADHDGKADPGDLIQYTIIVRNASRVPLTTVHVSDTLPAYTTYITNSTFVGTATSVAPVTDNPTGTPFPLDEGGIDLPGLPVRGVYTITFGVRVNFPLPPDLDRVRNVAVVQVGEDTQQPEVETPVGLDAAIDLIKEASARSVLSGTTVVYTYTITNVGGDPLSNVTLTDDRCAPLTPIIGGSGVLPIGGRWVYRCTAIIVEDTANIAVVTALDTRSNVVTDTATWTVDIPFYYIPIIITPPQPCPPPDGCPLANTKGFAVDEVRNLLYVTSRNPDRLLVVNPDSAQIITSAATGAQPWGVVANERTGRIYVSNFAGGDVWVYDAATLAVLAKIAVGAQPMLMEILPELDTVFVVVRDGSRIAVIQGLVKVQDVGSGGSGPYGIAADPINQRIFVSNRTSGHFATLRKVGGLWEAHSNVVFDDGRTLFDIAYNPINGRLYVVYAAAGGQWYVGVWKPSDTGLWGNEATIPVGDGGAVNSPLVGGTGLVVNPATGNVFNVNTAARSLSVIDGTQNRVKETIALGEDPFPAAVNSRTKIVFVGLRAPGRLIKIAD